MIGRGASVHLSGMNGLSIRRAPEPERHRRRLLISGGIVGIFVLGVVGAGVYGLLRGPAPASPPSPSATPMAASSTPAGDLTVRTLPKTRDAIPFARAVANRLFDWDTTDEDSPAPYMQVLVDAARPADQVMVAADVARYFPDQQTWAELRPMQVRQSLSITTAAIPAGWATAESQVRPGQLPPGAVAVTVDGIRHRTGTWHTTPAIYEHPVAFTIFVACPLDEPCRLLRLSGRDTPLR